MKTPPPEYPYWEEMRMSVTTRTEPRRRKRRPIRWMELLTLIATLLTISSVLYAVLSA